jgi:membrane fusion protein (multidrug efflux system)
MKNGKKEKTMSESKGESKVGIKRKRRILIWLIPAVIILLIGGLLYWRYTSGHVSTDDAFIEAHISPISPRVGGTVSRVLIKDNQWVNARDILIILDPSDYQVKVDQAKAALEAAQAKVKEEESDILINQKAVDVASADITADEADLQKTSSDLIRYRALLKKEEVSKQQYDAIYANTIATRAKVEADRKRREQAEHEVELSRAKLNSNIASVKQAQANLEEAKLQLSYTVITAPVSGKVTNKNVQVGQVVQPGQPIMALVERNPWVVANFKETQITHIKPGQRVIIEVDAYPGHEFYGHVDSVQSGSGAAFSLLPPENATGNYVKVTQRVPVKIVFDDLQEDHVQSKYILGPGMSVVPTVIVE